MARSKSTHDPLPEEFTTIEEAADFWETHSLADYWNETEEVHFDVDLQRRRYLVALAPDVLIKVAAQAQKQGISAETLVNLWLNEKLQSVQA